VLLSQPGDAALLIDGLAYGAFPESIAAASPAASSHWSTTRSGWRPG
jgi:hypothetical protein